MSNTFFQFKQFKINQKRSGMKVTTDACIFGARVAAHIEEKLVEPKQLLDIGTGTGLLALMLAQVTTNTVVTAIDMNNMSATEAAENFVSSRWADRLHSIHSSLQEFESNTKYELIICNPPFFGKNQKGLTHGKNQAIHNDHLSMEDLAFGIDRLLSMDGEVWTMYPEWEMKAFIKWMQKYRLNAHELVLMRNKSEAPVFRMIAKFSRSEEDLHESELIIRNMDGSYSKDFSRLLSDYYLNEI